MKLEEIIKKVIKINKFNEELYINKQYIVYLSNRYKSFTLDNTNFEELEKYWIDTVYSKLITKNFIYMSSSNSWNLEIETDNQKLYFELFILDSDQIISY